MERMGDKVRAKAEMRAAGVPLVPGTDGTAELEAIRTRRQRDRLPGPAEGRRRRWRKGMRTVLGGRRLERAFQMASAEAESNVR
jgi:acetyl-CoA carboxylase biotin carboxylase subunit